MRIAFCLERDPIDRDDNTQLFIQKGKGIAHIVPLSGMYNYKFQHHIVSMGRSHSSSVCDAPTVLLTKSCCCCCCCCFHSASKPPDDHQGCRARIPVCLCSIVSSRLSWTLSLRGPSRRDVSSCAIALWSTGSSTYLLRVVIAGAFCPVGFVRVGV